MNSKSMTDRWDSWWPIMVDALIVLTLLNTIIGLIMDSMKMHIRLEGFLLIFACVGLWRYQDGWRKFVVFIYACYALVSLIVLVLFPLRRFIPSAEFNIHSAKDIGLLIVATCYNSIVCLFFHHKRTRELFASRKPKEPPHTQLSEAEILPEVPIPDNAASSSPKQ